MDQPKVRAGGVARAQVAPPRRLQDLAHGLERKAPGARGLTQLMLNPECDRILVIRAAHVEPGTVSRTAYGWIDERGSKISFSVGVSFERKLMRDGARALVTAYEQAGILSSEENAVVDLKARHPGAAPGDLERRIEATRELVRARLASNPDAPAILLHPLCRMPALGGEVLIEPDVVVIPGGARPLRIGEIKALRDRGSRTGVADVARARAQAAAEVLAVRAMLSGLGVADPVRMMPSEGDLLLRRRVGMSLSRREVELTSEVDSLQRVLAGTELRLRRALGALPENAVLSDPAALERIPSRFDGACHSHCPLAARCESTARRAGDPAALGDAVSDALGTIGSIPRLYAIAEGREEPASEVEARIARDFLRVRATLHSLDERRAHAV